MKFIASLLFILLLVSCQTNTETNPRNILITTDKNVYVLNDTATVTFRNEIDNNLFLEYCGDNVKYSIEKFISGKWEPYSMFTCNDGPPTAKILKSREIFNVKVIISLIDNSAVTAHNTFRLRFIIFSDVNNPTSYIDMNNNISNTFQIN